MPNFFLSHKRVKVAARLTLMQDKFAPAVPELGRALDLEQTRRDAAQGPPKSPKTLKPWGADGAREQMKLLAGCAVSAGLLVATWSANAQTLAFYGPGQAPYQTVSDFDEPYGAESPAPLPQGAAPPYAPPPGMPYGYDPALIAPHEIYAVLRDNGFRPLGFPHRQGFTYQISAVDPDGLDGRLLIDGRNGRIIRFVPASSWGPRHASELTGPYGAHAALPPPTRIRGVPRPPAPIPHVADRDLTSRAVPSPAPRPAEAVARTPSQPQVSAVAPPPAATGTIVETKPAIKPTQDMPPVQALE